MPLGDGMTGLVQHATKQQNNNTYTKTSARSLSASKHQLDQHKSAERAPLVPQRHRNINTNTAYVEDTNVMEVTYAHPRHIDQNPLYSANQLAHAVEFLATYHLETPDPTLPPHASNPFSLAPSALQTWHSARTALSDPTYFYTTMFKNFPAPGEPRPEPEERFAVRALESTLEVEQGLADLRVLLKQCHQAEDDQTLEGLRERVGWAVQGL